MATSSVPFLLYPEIMLSHTTRNCVNFVGETLTSPRPRRLNIDCWENHSISVASHLVRRSLAAIAECPSRRNTRNYLRTCQWLPARVMPTVRCEVKRKNGRLVKHGTKVHPCPQEANYTTQKG
jgi:hypothetical protein